MRALLCQGREITESRYKEVLEQGEYARSQADALPVDYHTLLASGATSEAPVGLDSTGDPIFIWICNFLHMPSANVPVTRRTSGMPLAVKLVVSREKDEKLLAVLRWAEHFLAKEVSIGE